MTAPRVEGSAGTPYVGPASSAPINNPPSSTEDPNVVQNSGEDELQGVSIENEDLDADTPDDPIAQIQKQIDETTDEYNKKIRRYYEQIDTLREQMSSINTQMSTLAQEMGGADGVSQYIAQIQQMNSQKSEIYDSINSLLLNIMQLEDALSDAQQKAQSSIKQLQSLGLSASNTSAAIDALQSADPAALSFTPASTEPVTLGDVKMSTSKGNALAASVVNMIDKHGASKGWCLAGVNRALNDTFGFTFAFGSAYQSLGAMQQRDDFADVTAQYPNKSDLKRLPAGAIVIWDRDADNPHGHISIALGDGREASDHIANQYTNISNSYHVFVPIDT